MVAMDLVTTAIVPIVILLLTGAVLKRRVITDGAFWSGLSWLVYWVFAPALFIDAVAVADLGAVALGPLLLALVVPVLAVAALTLGLGRLLGVRGPEWGSLMQGTIRFNTYVGLVFVSALHGSQGVATFALAVAVLVPLVNLISVVTLAAGRRASDSGPSVLREVATNPLILACLIGLAVNLTGLPLPGTVTATLQLLAQPTLVCGTLLAGAALTLRVDRQDVKALTLGAVLKLAVLPLAALAIAVPLGITGPMLIALVVITALPVTPTAAVLASRMGGDVRLMSALIGTQTVLSVITLPALIALAERVGG